METQIYVGNLALSVDYLRLHHLFEPYGLLGAVYLAQDDSGAWAYITILNRRDALDAIDRLNGKRIDNQVIEVRLYVEDGEEPLLLPGIGTIRGILAQELLVSNLPAQTTRSQLRSLFKKYLVVKIRMRMRYHEAIIQVAMNGIGIAAAIEELDGYEWHGQAITVEYLPGRSTLLPHKTKAKSDDSPIREDAVRKNELPTRPAK